MKRGLTQLTISIEKRQLNRNECMTLAQMAIRTRRNTPLEGKKSVEELAKDIEEVSNNESFHMLVAMDNGTPVGWIQYYVGFPLMAFIEEFLPVVDSSYDTENIAIQLIEAAKKNIADLEYTRLEVMLVLRTEDHRKEAKNLIDWYTKCGFQFASEEAHMKCNLSNVDTSRDLNLENYSLKKFSEVSSKSLEKVCLEIFTDGDDDLFSSMNHAEQLVTAGYFFDKSRPFHDDASPILMKDDKILGFVITRIKGDEAEIGPVGLVEEARGKGLASSLFTFALQKLKNDHMNQAFLDMSRYNAPARKLYSKYGFNDEYYKLFYYWSP